ncbi:hypothetical protein HWV62_26706 [Athelia sp. TMB]|nr:hypothetical protein HWV62_26706 [Athelia sp. TMB]
MNVLVYAGPEVLQASLKHTLSSLGSILAPHYTVQSISRESLVSHPWSTSCALLVFPGCYALTPSPSIALVKGYVENGGALLALSSGAIYTSGLGFSYGGLGTLSGRDAALRFRDPSSNGSIRPTFNPGPESADSSVALRLDSGQELQGVPYNGASIEGFEDANGTQILAKIGDEIAAIRSEISKGRVAVWGPSIEVPSSGETASSAAETSRRAALRDTLTSLGLTIPSGVSISSPLPQYLSVAPDRQDILPQVIKPYFESSLKVLKERHDIDTLHFHDAGSDEANQLLLVARSRSISTAPPDPSEWQPKHIFICKDGALPSDKTYFDINLYYSALSAARTASGLSSSANQWGMGEALLYTEAVTSTQIMFDSNPGFMSTLGAPLLSIASHQLAGRGRGSNIWLSPSGCLQFSLLLRVPSMGAKIVFVQYLFGLAVAEACRDEGVLGDVGTQVRLKWPNDIYAVLGDEKDMKSMKKIGGILVNTRSCGNETEIIIGCGLNVLTEAPIFSLAQLLPAGSATKPSMERTAATIMAKFEVLWNRFSTPNGVSFTPLMDLYLERWLHSASAASDKLGSDQLVTLTTTTPHQAVRIVGITPDYGLLRTLPERTGYGHGSGDGGAGWIDLMPDGNSFDIMAGLIKPKK